MTFATLALVSAVALAGPLLAWPRRWHLPVVLGEIAMGVALGRTGSGTLHADDRVFTFLANVGFALVMFVAGSHVPIRDTRLLHSIGTGVVRAIGAAAVAAAIGFGLSTAFHTGHAPLYTVLIASSSAALILPIIDSLRLSGPAVLAALPQVAFADAACIVALPLAIDPRHAGRAALGALAVIGCALLYFLIFHELDRSGLRRRMHRFSERRRFALELRLQLIALFVLAAVAVQTNVSVMLAGFALGIATASVGEPRRLARQLFGLTEGFFSPLFFVWLGASLNLRELGHHPSALGLGALLGAGAVAAHLVVAGRSPGPAVGLLSSAQLGVPIAAVTLGSQLHLLAAGEGGAILLGAVITVVAATVGGALMSRRASASAAEPAPHAPSSA